MIHILEYWFTALLIGSVSKYEEKWEYVILQVDLHSQVKQKLHDVGVSGRTGPVQGGSVVLKWHTVKDKWSIVMVLDNSPLCRLFSPDPS